MNTKAACAGETVPDNSIRHSVLLVIDGLGDLPVAELGGKTPLEAAATPILDRLASEGIYGLVDPIIPGKIPNTHSGTGMLMGMLPEQADRLHRGPVEASGAGRLLSPGEVALRVNFASIEKGAEGLLVTDRRAGRITNGAVELAAELNDIELGDGVSASLFPTGQHRAALVLSGPGLDTHISNTDPGDSTMPAAVLQCKALRPEAEFTANKVNQFIALAYQRLHDHPVNIARKQTGKHSASGIISRGAGAHFTLDNVLNSFAITAAVVSGCNTVLGLGRIFGFDALSDARFSATVDTDLEAKIATVISALDDHAMVYLHVKAPDLCSHDRQPMAKRDFLERLDTALEPLLNSGAIIALTADHTTNSNTGYHTADPVPALICQPAEARTTVHTRATVNFGESACRQGTMGRQFSNVFLLRLLKMMGCKV